MPYDHQARLVELAAGVYVEEDTLRIVERIQDYDPNLVVKYLDPDRGGELGDPPYRIMERCPDGFERLVFGVWVLDESVIQRIFAADTQRHDIMARLESHNAKTKADQLRRYKEDVLGEAQEMVKAVIRSNKETYTLPGQDSNTQIVLSSTMPCRVRTKSGTDVPSDLK